MADLLDEGVILIPFDEEDNESNGNIAEENGVDGPMARSEIDLPEGPLFRFQAYRKAWDDCLERIKVLLLKLQKPIVEEAIQCIYESALKPDDEFLFPVQEIMTVVISCLDRAFAHTSLHYVRTILMMTGEPEDKLPRAMVSQIHDTDCTNLASMVKAMIAGFRSDPFHEKLNLKSSSDIQVLQSWIEEVKTELDTDILMIIILPDMSLIAPSLLADFLDLCHCHISDLPFTILTTASDTGYLNRTLPRSTLVKLRLEHFNLPCDRQVIEHIIEETFFSPEFVPRLMIGPSSLEMIISEYSQNNTTLDNLLSNLQILHLQHFYNPLSLLCVSSFDSFLSTTLQEPEESSKWMPFMKHVRLKLLSQNMSNSDWLDFSPVKVMENAIKGRNSFHTRIRDMKVALRIWGIIQKFCRARGVKAKTASLSLLEIQMKALQTGMGDTIADAVVSSFKALDRVQTEALLEELFYFINNLPAALRNLTTGIRSQITASMNQPNKSEAFCDFLVRYFRSTLISFDDIPLLDIWVTNEDTLPNSPFNPNVHVSIVTALLEPQGYLDWGTSHKQKDTSPLPDITLAFQRYVDSGRMINLYDWYQTFVTAFEGHDESEGEDEEDLMDIEDTPTKPRNKRPSRLTKGSKINKDKPRVDKKELQARFMRTVHELEFVGFLKRTGRRTEHVVKTVFDVMD